MKDTITIPSGVLSTLSFMSEILGDYDTFSEGMITWFDKENGGWFASLCWDEAVRFVEPIHNAIYTILGYCRYQGISHKLLGATLPAFKELRDEAA